MKKNRRNPEPNTEHQQKRDAKGRENTGRNNYRKADDTAKPKGKMIECDKKEGKSQDKNDGENAYETTMNNQTRKMEPCGKLKRKQLQPERGKKKTISPISNSLTTSNRNMPTMNQTH